jgi:very-short-patch-repair endonuclease
LHNRGKSWGLWITPGWAGRFRHTAAVMHWQDRARLQAGVIGRDQLLELGVTEDAVRGLVSRRELHELLPTVYSPRPVPASFTQRLWAAVLWSDGGAVSHYSAGRIWAVGSDSTMTVHITVDDRRFRKPVPGVRLHRVRLDPADRALSHGLPITTRARTVIDLLRCERYAAARDLRDRALQQGWVDEVAIRRSVSAQLGRTGNTQLRRLLAELEVGAQAESERKLHAILRRAGITGWKPQYRVRLGPRVAYVDVALPAHKIALEVDGRRFHDDGSDRFSDDRERQNDLIAAGWRVLRFTWDMLTEHPDTVLTRIVQLLAA